MYAGLSGAAILSHQPVVWQAARTQPFPYESLSMSLKLILMRHAKSDWNDPLQSDHERGLNPRGQASARALGDWLRGNGHLPDLCITHHLFDPPPVADVTRVQAEAGNSAS